MNIIKIIFPDKIKSPATKAYNCIAWAAGDNTLVWGTDEGYYWPPGVPRLESTGAYIRAYESIGFTDCTDGDFEEDFIKIALFVKELIANGYPIFKNGRPVLTFHAARQIYNGRWTSKCGKQEDIEHDLNEITELYGDIFCFMKKPA